MFLHFTGVRNKARPPLSLLVEKLLCVVIEQLVITLYFSINVFICFLNLNTVFSRNNGCFLTLEVRR
jgi:hypothetical protein